MHLEMAHRTQLNSTLQEYLRSFSAFSLPSLFPFSPSPQNSKFTDVTDAVVMCVVRVLPLASHPSLTFHLGADFRETSFYKNNIMLPHLFTF